MATTDIRAFNEELRTVDSATLVAGFAALGPPLAHPARMIKWKNDSDTDVTISYDGVTDHDIILAGDREVEDLTANKTIQEGLLRPAQTQVYVSGTAGVGNLYMIVIYADTP